MGFTSCCVLAKEVCLGGTLAARPSSSGALVPSGIGYRVFGFNAQAFDEALPSNALAAAASLAAYVQRPLRLWNRWLQVEKNADPRGVNFLWGAD